MPEQAFKKGDGQIGTLVEINDTAVVHQLQHVLRYENGALVNLLDGRGNMWLAKICQITRTLVTFQLLELLTDGQRKSCSNYQVISLLPLLKGPRFEWALEKLTELKVDRIIPFASLRTVVKGKAKEESEGRQRRWQNIIKEAAEQSERLVLPVLDPPLSLEEMLKLEVLDSTNGALNLLLSERDQAPNIVQLLESTTTANSTLGNPASIRICLLGGPEGGFTEEEKNLILASGFQKASLGSTILRGETAAILAAGIAYAIASTLD